ncbi:hypothetical protein B0H12DRAFT_263635 [Mycena haematopus]|nr:hypothetical protein B0H12DRAFT_263635 [Mycena haematopus]
MLFLVSFFTVFFWFLNSHALLVNVTIDDTTGDPLTGALVTYTPLDAWTESGPLPCTQSCPPGTPNVQSLNGWTYHNSTFSPNSGSFPNVPLTATVQFNAVYVYCALSRSPNANADMTFFLDGVVVGNFTQTPIGTAGFDYDVLVYANPSILPGAHTLTLQNGHQNGVESVMILDSIVYTSDSSGTAAAPQQAPSASYTTSASSTASSRRGPSGATVAVVSVLVVALVVILMVLGVCLYRRRRRRRGVYATYMPKGTVRSFPPDLATPSRPMSPASTIAPLPPVYAGGSGGNWWVGRDQKSRDVIHRPYADLDPSQAVLQHPPAWERKASYQY